MLARRLFTAAFAVVAAACGSGSGPLLQNTVTGQGDRPPSFLRDDPGSTRDDPGPGRDDPGVGQQSPGTTCIACDRNYHCRGVVDNTVIDEVVALTTKNGVCLSKDTVFGCDGSIIEQGQVDPKTTWHSDANGGFRLCSQGQCVVCTPTTESVPLPAQPGAGGGTQFDGG